MVLRLSQVWCPSKAYQVTLLGDLSTRKWFREGKGPAPGNTAQKWYSRNLNPNPAEAFIPLCFHIHVCWDPLHMAHQLAIVRLTHGFIARPPLSSSSCIMGSHKAAVCG